MRRHNFSLDDETIEALERIAKEVLRDSNKSAAIRFLVKSWEDDNPREEK